MAGVTMKGYGFQRSAKGSSVTIPASVAVETIESVLTPAPGVDAEGPVPFSGVLIFEPSASIPVPVKSSFLPSCRSPFITPKLVYAAVRRGILGEHNSRLYSPTGLCAPRDCAARWKLARRLTIHHLEQGPHSAASGECDADTKQQLPADRPDNRDKR
ncbi:hypothetical protein SKAU_G00401350 [Synaphobranchus kaupii]|uniref:Uncharacterized protein n=1 Tax=Synaphobranchus kaupii TaxID=118154 RepID=A0A9Q1E932_SYNKA|nr:hypothetical protein SKAU_G00401350 [Synaphobranchus kaupii]